MASARPNGNTAGPPPRTPPISSLSSLTRQSSIYTLTLEELQNAVNEPGKNFGSMNMDEFLKNIWTVEESQAMAAAMGGVGEGNGSSTGSAQPPSLQRQASLSIPKNLEGKTVDEIWKEIHRPGDQRAADKVQQRQMTFGEITLEDFLAKAGVMRDEGEAGPSAISSSSSSSVVTNNAGGMVSKVQPSAGMQATRQQAAPQQADWMNYQFKQQHQQLLQQQHLLQQQQAEEAAASAYALGRRLPSSAPTLAPVSTTANVMDVVPFETAVVLASSGLSPSRAVISPDTPTRGKKRMLEAHEEKAVEQRQKRMIKNRESAARSRARKQAYTVELEAEVTQLKEENTKLSHQQNQAMEERRKWLMETLIPVASLLPRPVRVLRRTRTTSW